MHGRGGNGRKRGPAGHSGPEEDQLDEAAVQAERRSLLERISNWLDLPLALLALVWAGLLVVELAVPTSPEMSARIVQITLAIWVVFAIVFVIEFALAPNKQQYLRSNFLAGLSLLVPFVRAVRVIQLARLLRSVSLARIVLISNHATAAAAELLGRNQFHYVVSLIALATLMGAAGVYFFERDIPGTDFPTFGEALWWAATMATTINISAEPVTAEGRIIGILLRVIALAVFGYLAGSIASYLVGRRVMEGEEAEMRKETASLAREVERLRRELKRMRGSD